MNNEVKDLIKQKLDIVDIIGEYVTLIPAGSNYKALSPFRSEKSPSFIVSPELQIYKDFGGDKAGDIFQFIMDIEGVEFREALQILSEKSGISLQSVSGDKSPYKENNKKILLNILQDSTKIYHSILVHPTHGEKGRQYLYERGLTDELIELFSIGLAPQNYQTLTKRLITKYSPSDIESTGMGIQGQQNHLYDRFRGRIMIPIQDTLGRVVGFTGRILPEYDDGQMGKYVNSPQTSTYDKSKVLFGLSQAKIAIKTHKKVILVEGQMDVIMSHKAGVKEVVAVSGTALSEYHITALMRYTDQFLLAFDNDSAGIAACLRSAALITQKGGVVKVIYIEGGKDAADLVRENPQLWEKAIEKAEDFIEYYLNHIVANIKSENIPAKNKALQQLIQWIQVINDPIAKNYYTKKLADLLNMSEKDIYTQMKTNIKSYNTDTVEKPIDSASVRLQKHIIAYLLYKPENRDILILEQSLFTQSILRELFIKIRDYCTAKSPKILNLAECKAFVSDSEYSILEELLLPIFYQIEQMQSSEAQIQQSIQETIHLLKTQYQSSVRKALLKKLKEAKKAGDNDKVQEILEKYKIFTKNTR
jgi:DNA primase